MWMVRAAARRKGLEGMIPAVGTQETGAVRETMEKNSLRASPYFSPRGGLAGVFGLGRGL